MARDPSLVILQGTLDVLILKALSAAPQHGYGISAWIRERTDGELGIEDGALYQALHRLEHRGSIDAEWGVSDNNRRARSIPPDARGPPRAAGGARQLAQVRARGLTRARRACMRTGTMFRRLFRFSSRTAADIERDIRDEVAFHLELRIRELMDGGATPEQARAEAHRQFGDVAATAAYCRRMDTRKETRVRMRLRTEELRQDLTYAARMLARQPGLTLVAVLTIAIGIGATALVFAVVHAALLAPLPYRDADRLVVTRLSIPDYRDMRESVRAFEAAGIWGSNLYTLDEEQVLGGVVTPSVFSTLGVAPVIGRTMTEADGDGPVAVLSYGLWQRRFGGSPQVVGRTVRLTGTAYTVIGVMPRRFGFPSGAFQLWTGMGFSMTLAKGQDQNRALRIFHAVARLGPGVEMRQAQAELTALAARLARVHPDTNAGVSLALVSLRDRQVGDVRPALLVALASVGCLLLIACANVANLVLARMTARTQELAVRAALGAGRGRIARQLVTESLLLAACGGAAGLLLARWGMLALPALLGDRVPRIDDVTLSMPVLLVAIGAIAATGVLVGLAPVVHLAASGIEPSLRGGGRGDVDTARSGRLRSALVVAQVAIAVIVLAGGLLLTHSLVRLLHVDTGVVPDRLLTFNVQFVQQPTPGARATTAASVIETIQALPGIEAAGARPGSRRSPRSAERRSRSPGGRTRPSTIAGRTSSRRPPRTSARSARG